MDLTKIWDFITNSWEVIAAVCSASLAVFMSGKKKKEAQMGSISTQLSKLSVDNALFNVKLQELKEDIVEIKEWIFDSRKRK